MLTGPEKAKKSRIWPLNAAFAASVIFLLFAITAPSFSDGLHVCGPHNSSSLIGGRNCSAILTLAWHGKFSIILSLVAIAIFRRERRRFFHENPMEDGRTHLPLHWYPWITILLAVMLIPVGNLNTLHKSRHKPHPAVSSPPPTWITTRTGYVFDLLFPHGEGVDVNLYGFFSGRSSHRDDFADFGYQR